MTRECEKTQQTKRRPAKRPSLPGSARLLAAASAPLLLFGSAAAGKSIGDCPSTLTGPMTCSSKLTGGEEQTFDLTVTLAGEYTVRLTPGTEKQALDPLLELHAEQELLAEAAPAGPGKPALLTVDLEPGDYQLVVLDAQGRVPPAGQRFTLELVAPKAPLAEGSVAAARSSRPRATEQAALRMKAIRHAAQRESAPSARPPATREVRRAAPQEPTPSARPLATEEVPRTAQQEPVPSGRPLATQHAAARIKALRQAAQRKGAGSLATAEPPRERAEPTPPAAGSLAAVDPPRKSAEPTPPAAPEGQRTTRSSPTLDEPVRPAPSASAKSLAAVAAPAPSTRPERTRAATPPTESARAKSTRGVD